MTVSHAARSRQGFTLLELLVAITILSIVVSTVYGAYRATFHIVHTTQAQTEIAAKARIALERITADLESLYLGDDTFVKGESEEQDGARTDRLSFLSQAFVQLGRTDQPPGLSTIAYFTERDDDTGRLQLYRQDSPRRPNQDEDDQQNEATPRTLLLCDDLIAVRFSYYGEQDDSEQDDWDSEAEETQPQVEEEVLFARLPRMFTVQLRFPDTTAAEEGSSVTYLTAVAVPQRGR